MTTKPVQEAKPERQGWRERFDEKFKNHFCCNGDYCYGPCSEVVEDDVKAFIESELRSALEGLEPENIAGTTDRILGWDECRIDVIHRIEARKKELGL